MSTSSLKHLGRFSLPGALLFGAACLLAVTPGRAATGTDTWTGATDPNFATSSDWTGANTPPASGDSLVFGAAGTSGTTLSDNLFTPSTYTIAGITFTTGAAAYTINPSTAGTNGFTLTSGITDYAANAEVINDLIALSGTDTFDVSSSSGSLTLGGVVSGTGALVKTGAGTLTLTAANTYTGSTTIDVGTLQISFTAASLADASSTVLNLNGGTLAVTSAYSSDTQTFTTTNLLMGSNVISVSGSGSPTLALGAVTETAGAVVEYVGPATIGASNVAVAATGTVTTTTAGGGTDGLVVGYYNYNGTNYANRVYATVGLYDYASTDTTAAAVGTSPYTIIGGSQVTGFYETTGLSTAGGAYDVVSTGTNTLAGNGYAAVQAVRFNQSGVADTLTFGGTVSGVLFDAYNVLGILVTPNVGAYNETIAGYLQALHNNKVATSYLTIWQNNTSGYLNVTARLDNNTALSGATTGLVQAGSGTVVYSGANTYTGNVYLDGGFSVVTSEQGFGALGSTATIYVDGGTIVGNATFAMDNSGASARTISLGSDGGGLAATSGNTMTIDGVISGSNVTDSTALTIGIAASSANNNTTGLLSGTGSGTANTTAVYATGTVVLSGNNTYTNGTKVASGTLLAENTSGSATGSGSLTAASGTTVGGTGYMVTSSFSLTGVTVLVGQVSTSDTNTTKQLTITGTSASSFTSTTMDFNINTTYATATTSGNILNVGSTAITFSSDILNVTLVGTTTTSEQGDTIELVVGTGSYSGLTYSVNSLGQEVITSGITLTGSVLSTYADSYLYLDSSGDIDIYLTSTAVAAPEPRTTMLTLLGLGAFGLMHLRRRRQV